jgi:hypothetical protein
MGLLAKVGEPGFGSAATGSGQNCGFLGSGGEFAIDVTNYFTGRIGTDPFDMSQFGIGITTSGTSSVGFKNVRAEVKATLGGPFTPGPFEGAIAIWGDDLGPAPKWTPVGDIGDPNPFGSALKATYTPTGLPVMPLGAFRGVDFSFNNTGKGGFGSWKASPDQIGLTAVESFIIRGQLDFLGNQGANNIVSFAVGPGGVPIKGTSKNQ